MPHHHHPPRELTDPICCRPSFRNLATHIATGFRRVPKAIVDVALVSRPVRDPGCNPKVTVFGRWRGLEPENIQKTSGRGKSSEPKLHHFQVLCYISGGINQSDWWGLGDSTSCGPVHAFKASLCPSTTHRVQNATHVFLVIQDHETCDVIAANVSPRRNAASLSKAGALNYIAAAYILSASSGFQ